MKRIFTVLLFLATAGCMQTQGTQSLSGDALEAKFKGRTMEWTMVGQPQTIAVTLNADGTGFGVSDGERRDMEWNVKGTGLCIDFPGSLGDPEDCAQVFWTGPDSVRLVRTSKSGGVMEFNGKFTS